jgi:hypothetical protein
MDGTGQKLENPMTEQRKAVVVYQAGIANLFVVENVFETHEGRNAHRLMQSGFNDCEMYARGLKYAGWRVEAAHCNRAGDVAEQVWNFDLSEAPFRESMHPVRS